MGHCPFWGLQCCISNLNKASIDLAFMTLVLGSLNLLPCTVDQLHLILVQLIDLNVVHQDIAERSTDLLKFCIIIMFQFAILLLQTSRSKMKKYGLQLRAPSSQQKKQPGRPPFPTPLGFHDEDEDDVEREISRQASKNKALKDVSSAKIDINFTTYFILCCLYNICFLLFTRLRSSIRKLWKRIPLYLIMTEYMMTWNRKWLALWSMIGRRERYLRLFSSYKTFQKNNDICTFWIDWIFYFSIQIAISWHCFWITRPLLLWEVCQT